MLNVIISIIIIVTYVLYVCIVNKRIPSSLSETVFYIPSRAANLIWILTICSATFLVMPTLITCVPATWQFLAFLSCAGLLFVGAAPLVKDETDLAYKVHMTAAWLCSVFSQLMIAVTCPHLLFGWFPWFAVYLWYMKKKTWRTATFWAEMTCFALIYALCFV